VRSALHDVVVLGGGPGGSTVAGRLAQAGLDVVVLEKELFPRFHLGESLLPMSLPVFDALGVTAKLEARLIRKNGAWFIDGLTGEEVTFKFAHAVREGHPYAFHGPRAEIDRILLDHAAELGADVRQQWTALRLIQDGDGVTGVTARRPDGSEERLVAKVVVDATGRDALSSRRSGKVRTPRLERTLAVFSHFDGCHRMRGDDEGDIRIVIVPQGWFWVIPFRGNRTSVGVVLEPSSIAAASGNLDEVLDSVCEASPVMRDVMRGSTKVFPARAAADFSYRVRRTSGDGWLALGDAAGFIDPLFSTGFHLAVKGADLAATAVREAIAAGDVSKARWADYERMANQARETYIGVVQAFYEGSLVRLLFETKKRDMMRKMITSVLAGDVFHAEQPRWLREVERRYPAALADGAVVTGEELDADAGATLG
jgi:flavin-dependent dehydrogenase